jgi:hypothetical protein
MSMNMNMNLNLKHEASKQYKKMKNHKCRSASLMSKHTDEHIKI